MIEFWGRQNEKLSLFGLYFVSFSSSTLYLTTLDQSFSYLQTKFENLSPIERPMNLEDHHGQVRLRFELTL